MQYIKPEKLSIRLHPELSEKWVQERIASDPSILGLGDLIVRDKERIQPKAGRLDLLLQDSEGTQRYEVEIQLGQTDETHIIRTIEYWDLERKRYPGYDHTAVIIAEDITSRFLNVIGLFNGFIPLIALQMNAIKIDNYLSLVFTKVLDHQQQGVIDDDEDFQETVDRAYWEQRGTKQTVAMVDELLKVINNFDSQLALKYNKFYIGLAKNDQANNFAVFRPQKNALRLEIRLPFSDDMQSELLQNGLDVTDYRIRRGRYRIRLLKGDTKKHEDTIAKLLENAYQNSSKT